MKTLQKVQLTVCLASVLVGISYLAYGQQVSLKLKDSTRAVVKVVANSTKDLRTSMGESIPYSSIAQASVSDFNEKRDRAFIEKMRAAGVIVTSVPSAPADYTPPKPQELQIVAVDPMEQFRTTRNTGKALQLIGALAWSATLIMNSIATDQTQKDIKSGAYLKTGYTAPAQMPSIVPVIGSVFVSVGLVIDLNAGAHLKRVRVQ